MPPVQPTVADYLDSNSFRHGTELTNEGRAILIALQELQSALGGGGGTQRTAAVSTVTASGTVAAGKRYVEFILSEDFVGMIAGVPFDGVLDAVYGLPQLSGGDTYSAIEYTISVGSARLTTF